MALYDGGRRVGRLSMVNQRIVDHMQQVVIEHHQALGRVVVAWARLEFEISFGIWSLAKVDAKIGACLTTQIMGAGRLLDSYIALAKLRPVPAKIVARLHSLQQRTHILSERRNRLIHDSWSFDPPGGVRHEMRVKGKLSFEAKAEPAGDIEAVAVEIEQHTIKFQEIAAEVGAASPEN